MIFEDPSGNRWKITLAVFAGIIILCTALILVFAGSIFFPPILPSIETNKLPTVLEKTSLLDKLISDGYGNSRLQIDSKAFTKPAGELKQLANGKTYAIAGYVNQNEPASLTDFKNQSLQINLAFPNWYAIKDGTCRVDEQISENVKTALAESNVRIVPHVSNYDMSAVYGSQMTKALKNKSTRDCMASALADRASLNGAEGILLDFIGLESADAKNYSAFISKLNELLHKNKKTLAITLPFSDPTIMKELSAKSDLIVLAPQPGSISNFGTKLADVMKALPPEKVLVTLNSGGMDEVKGAPPKRLERFSDIMALSKRVGALPKMEPKTGLMEFYYLDEKRIEHKITFYNGASTWNEWWLTRQFPILGFAVKSLGNEDPSVWSFINDADSLASSTAMVPALEDVGYKDAGEVFRISSAPSEGALAIRTDDRGFIADAQFTALPAGYVLERIGRPIPDKNIVITFDAGPDPKSTLRILDALDRLKISAVFFVVGKYGQENPGLLKEINARGHLLGNHTYSYSPVQNMSESRLRVELNTTQRIIEAQNIEQTVLFRPPFDPDRSLWNQDLVKAVFTATKLGYIIVDTSIDTKDWQNPGADKIASTIENESAKPNNHIVLLHDRNTNADQTISALEQAVPSLRAKGFQFVSLDEAISVPVSALNPPRSVEQALPGLLPTLATSIRNNIWTFVYWLFAITLVISILRILMLSFFVIRSARRGHKRFRRVPANMFVSILVPAYNEEKTILKTINSIQRSHHKNFEALVINDGSTDQTARAVKEVEKTDKRFRLINKPNGGKSSALNLGLQTAKSDLVITIDADTLLFPETVTELLKSFADPSVDAVCGNVEVGNRNNLLTGFQSLEYVTSQNFDRRAFDELNCISVVPGATGAWRKHRLLALGGYANDTLTEDADITLRLLRDGGRIIYCATAKSQTEAPETIGALAKQRFRWSYGTFQCMRKHWGAFFQGPLGWIALPNMFVFQILFPLLAPIGDVVLILMLFRGDVRPILIGYIIFTIMDACGSILAFTLEKRPKREMWLVLIQRFFYRQFMYVTTFRSIFAILRGERYGWNKLKRLGTVPEKFVAFVPTATKEPLRKD